jgi:hypothetical protein
MEEYDETYVPPVVTSVGDARTISFQTRIINQHLVCTLCMGYFNDACTIIECLHTFCRVCIMRHFRDSSMCPQCELQLGTNPKDLVRTDRTLQSIVDKVFPPPPRKASGGGGEEGEDGGRNGGTAAANSVDVDGDAAGMQPASEHQASLPESERQDGEAAQTAAFHVDDGTADGNSASESAAHAADGGGANAAEKAADTVDSASGASSAEVSFSLLEYGGGLEVRTPLEKPYLRTKALLSIGHLRKYLGKKLSLPPEAAIEFFCRDEPLDSGLTLDQIARTVWKDETADLVLHYRATAM